MLNRSIVWCLLLSLLSIFTLHGIVLSQQLPVTIYNEKQGIDNVNAVRTFQDSKGWIWVSTGNGVYRYEGNTLRYFPPPAGYAYHYIFAFVEVEGAIWCFDNQERIFTIQDQQVKLLEEKELPPRFRSMVRLSGHTYLFLYDKGLALYKDHRFYPLYKEQLKNIHDDNDEMQLLQVQDSLMLYKKSNGYLVIFNLHARRQIILNRKIRTANRDRSGNTWILTSDYQLLQLKYIDWAAKMVHLASTPVKYRQLLPYNYTYFCWDIHENLWLLADNKGLVKISATGKTNLYAERNGLPGIAFLSMMPDRENNLWVTASGSLVKLNLSEPVQQFTISDGLLSNEIWHLTTLGNNNTLWVSTTAFQKFTQDGWETLQALKLGHGLENIVQKGDKFYAHDAWELYELRLNKEENKVLHRKKLLSLSAYFYPSPYGLSDLKIFAPDTLVLATISGLHMYHNGKFYKLPGFKDEEEHFKRLFIDKKGYLWAGMFAKGLFQCRLRPGKDSFTVEERQYWKSTKANMPAIAWIRSLMEDDDGNMWVGTRFDGLFQLRRDTAGKVKRIVHYNATNGLSDNTVWNIAKDHEGRLWLATNGGLDMVHKNSKGKWEITPFSNKLNLKQCKGVAITNDSLIWVDNFPGVACINMHKVFTQQTVPFQVAITQCTVQNQADSVLYATLKTRYLKPADNDLSFELGVNTYTNENYTQYSYLLEGAGKTWSPYGRNYRVNFSNLQPGSYTFRARAMNKDGKISTNIAAYTFVIRYPYYQQWWFIAALLLLIPLAAYLVYRYRLGQIRKQVIFELHLAESEMKALRAQMNPHFIFNCMTAIDTFILKSDRKNASRFLNKFSKLVRLVLENSQRPLIDLEKEIKCLELYIQLEQIRFKQQFDYKIDIDEQLLAQEIKLPPLLFQPYIENAILHGLRHKPDGGGLLEFRLFAEGNAIKGIIRDNGVGRIIAAEINGHRYAHASMGLKITADRLKLLKQAGYFDATVVIRDLYHPDGNPEGTEVLIELNDINRYTTYKSVFET